MTSRITGSTSVWRQTDSNSHTTCLLWVYILKRPQQQHGLPRMPLKQQPTPVRWTKRILEMYIDDILVMYILITIVGVLHTFNIQRGEKRSYQYIDERWRTVWNLFENLFCVVITSFFVKQKVLKFCKSIIKILRRKAKC